MRRRDANGRLIPKGTSRFVLAFAYGDKARTSERGGKGGADADFSFTFRRSGGRHVRSPLHDAARGHLSAARDARPRPPCRDPGHRPLPRPSSQTDSRRRGRA